MKIAQPPDSRPKENNGTHPVLIAPDEKENNLFQAFIFRHFPRVCGQTFANKILKSYVMNCNTFQFNDSYILIVAVCM